MSFNPAKHNRRSVRLRGWDYARASAYFVTVCTQNRECLFGNVVQGEMRLNDFGLRVKNIWDDLPNHYPTVVLDSFVIMPNHIHGIIALTDGLTDIGAASVGARFNHAPTNHVPTMNPMPVEPFIKRHALGEIIQGLKSFSTRRINESRNTPGMIIWQRNYHEHIVRNDDELIRIRRYIANNPRKWESDLENPALITFAPATNPKNL